MGKKGKGKKNMKLYSKKSNYVDKKTGETKNCTNFYLVLENGIYVAIRPVFNDYKILSAVAQPFSDKGVEK